MEEPDVGLRAKRRRRVLGALLAAALAAAASLGVLPAPLAGQLGEVLPAVLG